MTRLEHDIRRTLQAQASVDLHDPQRLERVKATRRRQVRTTRLLTGALTVAVVVAVALVAAVLPSGVTRTEPVTGPSRPSAPTSVPEKTDTAAVPPAPAIRDQAVRDVWDPATASRLPTDDVGLPADLDPTGVRGTTSLTGTALALAHRDDELVVLDQAGWMDLAPPPGLTALSTAALSPDGRKVAAVTATGLVWRDLRQVPGGSWTPVDTPQQVRGEGVQITWFPTSDQVVLNSWNGGRRVDLVSGSAVDLPYLRGWAPVAVAPDGHVVASTQDPDRLEDRVDDDPVSSIPRGGLEGLGALVANRTTVAATRIDVLATDPRAATDRDGLAVFDRQTASTWAFLAFAGDSGQWVDGGQVVPVQWLPGDVLLFTALDPTTDRRTLVRWDPHTTVLRRVSSVDAAYDVTLAQLGG